MKFYTILFFSIIASITVSNAQCLTSSRPGVHVVQTGENLYRISMKYNVSIDDLCEWNNIHINHVLSTCSEIRISAPGPLSSSIPNEYNTQPDTRVIRSNANTPDISRYQKQPGNRHTVQAGETLAGLAALYGYTEARFREFNAIGPVEEVTPGSIVLSSDCDCNRIGYNYSTYAGNEGAIPSNYNNPGNTGFYPTPTVDPNLTPSTTSPTPTTNDNRFTIPTYTEPANTNINNRRPEPLNGNTPTSSGTTGTSGSNPLAPSNAAASYMSQEELGMVEEINLMRSNPSAYVSYVQAYVIDQKSNNGFPINQTVVDELIRELRNTSKLSILVPTPCIYRAAEKHGQDILQRGNSDHRGSDGSWPWDRVKKECPNMTDGNENLVGGPDKVREAVIILLIDDGIPNRGHRKTLLNPQWKYAATYKIGKVGYMPNSWIQKFGY